MAWGQYASARGIDQLGGAYRSAVECVSPRWVAASWHSSSAAGAVTESLNTASKGGGAGGGGIELSWRQLHSVKTSPITHETADSTPKSR